MNFRKSIFHFPQSRNAHCGFRCSDSLPQNTQIGDFHTETRNQKKRRKKKNKSRRIFLGFHASRNSHIENHFFEKKKIIEKNFFSLLLLSVARFLIIRFQLSPPFLKRNGRRARNFNSLPPSIIPPFPLCSKPHLICLCAFSTLIHSLEYKNTKNKSQSVHVSVMGVSTSREPL